MHLMYFTEQPMSAYDEHAADEGVTALLFSNEHFDSEAGARLYRDRLTEYQFAEEVGVDGIMLNEHHNAPFCMQAKCNIWASVLAGATERVKIVLLGNPLPLADNPIRLAEELAMIDMISQGRLVSGFVRGGGTEQLATGVNPAFNRERFEEAHDLIVEAWTRPGPFRWEGNHYQHRVVNPWATPLQQPHPRVWIPGVLSRETVVWAAKHRYPYIALNTTIEATKRIWQTYDDAAHEVGYDPGPENRGYLLRVHCADTTEKALEKRLAVHVDAGRIHRAGAPRLEQSGRLRLAAQPRSAGRSDERPPPAAARQHLRKPGREHADHRRHARRVRRQAARDPRRDPPPAFSRSGATTGA